MRRIQGKIEGISWRQEKEEETDIILFKNKIKWPSEKAVKKYSHVENLG